MLAPFLRSIPMVEIPSPQEAAQARCRRGALGVFSGLKLLGAGLFLPMRRRYKVGLGLGGAGLLVTGALAWWAGHQTQKELQRTATSREVKPQPGQPPAASRKTSSSDQQDR
jgi:hypothetical protein